MTPSPKSKETLGTCSKENSSIRCLVNLIRLQNKRRSFTKPFYLMLVIQRQHILLQASAWRLLIILIIFIHIFIFILSIYFICFVIFVFIIIIAHRYIILKVVYILYHVENIK